MELKTNCDILIQQLEQSSSIVSSLQAIANAASELANQENGVADVTQQVKSLMASATIQMEAVRSQNVLVQQTIDKILSLVNITETAAKTKTKAS